MKQTTAVVRMMLAKAGLRPTDLAKEFGCTRQNLNTKFTRGSWNDEDLAHVAEFTGGQLMVVYPDGIQILIDRKMEG